VMIIAGTELNIAREILIRFDELFHNKQQLGYAFQDLYENKWQYNELIRRSSIYSQQPIIEFKNDTRVFCFAASKQGKSQSFRGPDDIVCIFLSEAAHTGMLEDQPIMNALEPNLANRDDGDLIVESTPNGKRGFFYNYWIDAQEGKNSAWKTLQWDYNTGLKYGVLSAKYIEEQKNNQRIDFEQEYCCQFTSTVTTAFHKEDLYYLSKNEKPIDLLTLIGKKSI
ncbi:MAG: terminase large subunit domain-containing protein, partial [Nitrosopumilaceae archaeon]